MDEALRELRLQWQASHSPEDELRFLSACVRAGAVDSEWLHLAAYCGLPVARELANVDGPPPSLSQEWILGLRRWDQTGAVCVALGAARAGYPTKRRGRPQPKEFVPPMALVEAWLRLRAPQFDAGSSRFDGVELRQFFLSHYQGASFYLPAWVGKDPPDGCVPPRADSSYPHDVTCVLIDDEPAIQLALERAISQAQDTADHWFHLAQGGKQFGRGPAAAAGRRKENGILGFGLLAAVAACRAIVEDDVHAPAGDACSAASFAVHKLQGYSVGRAVEAYSERPKLVGDTAPILESIQVEVAAWLLGYGLEYRERGEANVRAAIDAKDPCTCLPRPGTPEGKARGVTWAAYYGRKRCPLHKK